MNECSVPCDMSPTRMRDAYVRKEVGVECSTCLTIVPGLNRTGYENRLAGFRLPDVIGKEKRDLKSETFSVLDSSFILV